ncbi:MULTISPECIES: cytochrome c family protein [unclassified Thalassospira]|uniref:c-type cytochrome n=1 Tax=unclassified Thalassospira TaxID=2648997 RepID=UPI000A1D72EB|nr:c-type cytochrome [Thalassospira sp. MCCC 1A01428]OSQ45357.1 cytochrome C [Thalassospira sp. MCCC 1A01428]
MNSIKMLAIAISATAMFSTAAFAAGDAAKGEKVFKKCAACHSIEEGKNKVGPSLHSVIGRECGAISDYKYSKGYQDACEKGFTIDEAFLDEYLKDPSAKISAIADTKERSKMTFKLKKEEDIQDVTEYLKQN